MRFIRTAASNLIGPPFIASRTVVWPPQLPATYPTFIASRTMVWPPTVTPSGGAATVSQEVAEVLVSGSAGNVLLSQTAVEVLHTNTSGQLNAGLSQFVVEVIVSTPISLGFIGSNTHVYTPVVSSPTIDASFIASRTIVHPPSLSGPEVDVPFLVSATRVYTPTLQRTFTGGGVSQITLEVLSSTSTAPADVSQVTLEVLIPRPPGRFQAAHV